MKTILCATDYSKNSEAALKYAYSLSIEIGATLKVVHVFDYPTMLDHLNLKAEDAFPDIEGDALKTHYSKLSEFCTRILKAELDELKIEIEAIEDKSVVHGIISKVEETGAFILVTGMKGGSALREFFMGNTTRHLIDKAPCFVLAIPEDESYRKIDTIVYATDYDEEADIEVIQKLSGIAKVFDATIKTIHISTKKDYDGEAQMELFKKMLKEKVDYKKIDFEILFSEDIFETLRIYLGDVGADLVVMLERKKTGFLKKLFHQDLVKKMEVYGRIPLMSFNENNFGMFHFLALK